MADPRNVQAEIDAVDAEIKRLESKEERLEAALEGNGSYLGTTDHVRFDMLVDCLSHQCLDLSITIGIPRRSSSRLLLSCSTCYPFESDCFPVDPHLETPRLSVHPYRQTTHTSNGDP